MSDESPQTDPGGRPLTAGERRLVQALLEEAADLQLPLGWLDGVKVCPMDDGGMGGLRFLSSSAKTMRNTVAEVRFHDSDGVEVVASLNLDDAGIPFELDVWKVDFSPLVQVPQKFYARRE